MDQFEQRDIVAGYRFILGRDPEPELDYEKAATIFNNWEQLRESILSSPEARSVLFNKVIGDNAAWVRFATFFGRQIYICLSDTAVSKSVFMSGHWEPEIEDGLQRLFTPGMTFLDVGANIGWFTLLAGNFVAQNGGAVISVEANPNLLPYLIASVMDSGLSNCVSVKPYAVAKELGLVAMGQSVRGNVGGLGILPSDISRTQGIAANVVPCVKLDDILDGIEKLDLVKMDIEGAESLAIAGFETTIARCKPSIVMEINRDGLDAVSHCSVLDLCTQLSDLGYNCYDFRKQEIPKLITKEECVDIVGRHNYYDFLFRVKDVE